MSVTFQNADSIKQALFEELQKLLSNDSNLRNNAEVRMKQLEFTEGYAVYLAEFIMNQSFDLALRQLACIMLTRYVEEYWDRDGEETSSEGSYASEQAKKTIRNILPNGLYDPNSKIRSAVAHTISTIAQSDWPTIWTELFDIIIKCLGGNEDSIHGALLILQDFTYDEQQIKKLGPVVISEVYRIFEQEQVYSLKTRTSAIKILKPLFTSISGNVTDKKEQTAMMNLVLSNFMEKLIHYLSVSSGNYSNFILKTEIVKIFTYLVIDMPKYINPFINQILPPIWQLLTQIADVYVKAVVNQTEPNAFGSAEDEEDELCDFTTMIIQLFEFVQCLVTCGKFNTIVQTVQTDLIYIMIVFIQVTEEQMENWRDDPEKFVEEEEDGVELTVRLSSCDVLTSLRDVFGPKMLLVLSEALSRHMNVAEAEKNSGNPNWWKIYEACMVAVHIFKDLILETDGQFDLLNYLTFVRNLLNFQNAPPQLLGRCLWTLSSYASSSLYNPQMLEEVLTITLNSITSRENDIILKISAVRAIYGFLTTVSKGQEEKRVLIIGKLLGFVDGILDLFQGCKPGVLGLLLEALTVIISFDMNFTTSVCHKIIPLTIAVFLKYPEDPYILELVQEMLKALSQNPHCLKPLQEKIIPTLVSILNLQGEQADLAKQDIALDVLTTVVKYSEPPLRENLIETAFPAVVHCILRTDDNSVMVSGGECLRAFISVSPDQICSYKNGEGLNYIMQVTTMLLNPMNNEMTAGQIGRLVITIISKMGNLLGDNIDLLLKAVISKMQLVECLKVVMSLVVIFAHLFLTQMDAVLHFLSTVPGPTGEPAMQFVISNWLSKQSMFFGAYERKVTTMSLCKLFEYGVTTQDNRITSINVKEQVTTDTSNKPSIKTRSQTTNQWVTIPALVKIFKLLISELNYLKDLRISEQDSDSWTDDDENNTNDGIERSPPKIKYVSDLYFNDDDEENTDDDQMISELMKDPIFQANMEDNLTKFLQNFSTNEHFSTFAGQLNDTEKKILQDIQIKV